MSWSFSTKGHPPLQGKVTLAGVSVLSMFDQVVLPEAKSLLRGNPRAFTTEQCCPGVSGSLVCGSVIHRRESP